MKKILRIDKNTIMLNKNDKEWSTTKDIPDGHEYAKKFIIDKDYRRGIAYAQCNNTSKYSVSNLKYGTMNIFNYLKTNQRYPHYRKVETIKEASITFLSHIHLDATLKLDFCKDLNLLLKTAPLKHQEQ